MSGTGTGGGQGELAQAGAEEYGAFLESKRFIAPSSGHTVRESMIHPRLFPHQKALVQWAVRKGRAAVFASTGLGKTLVACEWARLTGQRTLMLAPLTVARQTVREAATIGLDVRYARHQEEAGPGITITNYDMVDHFAPDAFGAVVADESSILKSLDGKTRQKLTEMWKATPYRLCCTATPAPNDITELANHAEFLGVMRRTEMLAAFFVHDESQWRLKGHATVPFYRWLASWAMACRLPSDLGAEFSDEGYVLPPLSIEPLWVDADVPAQEGKLFFSGLHGITDRTRVRRATLSERVAATAELVNASPEPWIVWAGLNEESAALAAAIPDAVEVVGSQSPEQKAAALEAFASGGQRVLVTKPRIAGWGLNLQHCAHMAFVGLSDSWEAYYQCIRRCYRFGQTRPVHVSIVLSRAEEEVYANVMHKEQEAATMTAALVEHMQVFEQHELRGGAEQSDYRPTKEMRLPAWLASEMGVEQKGVAR